MYPICVDTNILDTSYSYYSPFIYKEQNLFLSRSTKVEMDSVIGSETKIGEKTQIIGSVIGRNCKIGNNVTILQAYLWEGVEVGDNCVVIHSILCNGVKVFEGSTIKDGCIISYGVHIGPNTEVETQTKLILSEIEESTASIDLGEKGKGFKWIMQEEEKSNRLWPFEEINTERAEEQEEYFPATGEEVVKVQRKKTLFHLFHFFFPTIESQCLRLKFTILC